MRTGIAAHVRFVGAIAHAELPRHLGVYDLVVLPSAAHGAPLLVYREAQACGRVVVASDIPAARDAIEDGETGVLFRCGDVADLAAKTLAVARDRASRAHIGERARAAAETRTVARWAAAYEAVLGEVAGGRSPPGHAPARRV